MRLIEQIYQIAERHPKKIALISEKNQLTFLDLISLVAAFREAMGAQGVQKGARILLASTRSEFVIVGALVASLDGHRIIFGSPEKAGKAGVDYDVLLSEQAPPEDTDVHCVQIRSGWFDALVSDRLIKLPEPSATPATYVGFTSGSTGTPQPSETLEKDVLRPISTWDPLAPSNERLMFSASPSESWARNGYLKHLSDGGSIVALSEHRSRLLQYIDLYQVTLVVLSPASIPQIAAIPDARHYFSSVKYILLGGAYISSRAITALRDYYHGQVLVGFGSSEIGGLARDAVGVDEPFEDGYIGKLTRDDLEIFFHNGAGTILKGTSEGQIGYRFLGDATVQRRNVAVGQPGWSEDANGHPLYWSTDIMRSEGDRLYFVGRASNIINFGGNKVALEDINAALEKNRPFR